MGIIKKEDFKISKDGNKIIIKIVDSYTHIILRSRFYTYLTEASIGKVFDATETKEGKWFVMELVPGLFKLKVALSYKTRRGSIKVSERDLKKLELGIIEDVELSPVGKDIGVIEMMFAEARVPPGFVFMNIGDANSIGVKDGDMVIIERRSPESASDLDSEQESETDENQESEHIVDPTPEPQIETEFKTQSDEEPTPEEASESNESEPADPFLKKTNEKEKRQLEAAINQVRNTRSKK